MRIRAAFIALFCLALLALPAASFLLPDHEISLVDYRELQQEPELTPEGVLNGEYQTAYEAYSLDQAAGRAMAVRAFYALQNLLGKTERNGYVEVARPDGLYLLEARDVVTDPAAAAETARAEAAAWLDTLAPLRAAAEESGGRFIILDIPHKNELWVDLLPWYYERRNLAQTARAEALLHNAQGYDVVDARPGMAAHRDEAVYFRTDNHFTFLGAYYAYAQLLEHLRALEPTRAFALPAWADMQSVTVPERFEGLYCKSFGIAEGRYSDQVVYALPDDYPVGYERWNNGEPDETPTVVARASYNAFMQNDYASTVVDTHRPELPSVLLLGHSYTNALEAWAVYNFGVMSSIDPRYYEGDLCEAVRACAADYVVVVRDDLQMDRSRYQSLHIQ